MPNTPRKGTNQFPPNARKPLNLATARGTQQLPGIPGLGEEGKQQLNSILGVVMEALKPKHQPVLNSLKSMGIASKVMNVGGEACLIIPVAELMQKEYLHMSGVDISTLDVTDE